MCMQCEQHAQTQRCIPSRPHGLQPVLVYTYTQQVHIAYILMRSYQIAHVPTAHAEAHTHVRMHAHSMIGTGCRLTLLSSSSLSPASSPPCWHSTLAGSLQLEPSWHSQPFVQFRAPQLLSAVHVYLHYTTHAPHGMAWHGMLEQYS
jgi:hypothetical protein